MEPPGLIRFIHGKYTHQFEQRQYLGSGRMGDVYRVTDERGHEFAMRRMNCQNTTHYGRISEEISVLLDLEHPNIVSMYGVDNEDGTSNVIAVMEYCSHGSLNQRLLHDVDRQCKFKWMQQLVDALSYLHTNHIVHRDLKPSNVLVNERDDVKLGDFGVARKFLCLREGRVDFLRTTNDYLSEYMEPYMDQFAGTPYWLAPEVFEHKYNEKADIFSLGIVFCAIVYQRQMTFKGRIHFAVFMRENEANVGLGMAMFEKKKQMYPDFLGASSVNPENASLDEMVIRPMLSYCDRDRITLYELKGRLLYLKDEELVVTGNVEAAGVRHRRVEGTNAKVTGQDQPDSFLERKNKPKDGVKATVQDVNTAVQPIGEASWGCQIL